MTLVDRDYTRAKEGIVEGRDEEVWLFNEVEFISDIDCSIVMLYSRVARLKGGDFSYLVASIQFSVFLHQIAVWMCLFLEFIILLELFTKYGL